MIAFALVIALGIGVGLARGGSLRNVSSERLALLPVVWGAAVMQIGAQFVPGEWSMVAYALVIVSYAALFAFAGANWRVPGMLLIAIGAALNYAVILANQGMPISIEAAARAGFAGDAAGDLVLRGKHFVTTGEDVRWLFLGDIIPLWRQPAVASIGDLVIWAGMIVVVQDLMRPRGRRKVPARRLGRRSGRRPAPEIIDVREAASGHVDDPARKH